MTKDKVLAIYISNIISLPLVHPRTIYQVVNEENGDTNYVIELDEPEMFAAIHQNPKIPINCWFRESKAQDLELDKSTNKVIYQICKEVYNSENN